MRPLCHGAVMGAKAWSFQTPVNRAQRAVDGFARAILNLDNPPLRPLEFRHHQVNDDLPRKRRIEPLVRRLHDVADCQMRKTFPHGSIAGMQMRFIKRLVIVPVDHAAPLNLDLHPDDESSLTLQNVLLARSEKLDLDEYEDWAIEECLFMSDLLEREGEREILESCMLLGRTRLAELVEEYQAPVQEFFHTPREQRLPLLDRFEALSERHAFLVAADYEARCAAALLRAVCKKGVVAGPAKSMIFLQSAAAAREVVETLPPLNPFDEDHPFGYEPDWIGRDD